MTTRHIDIADGGVLVLWEQWLSREEADRAFEVLLREIPWEDKEIVIAGRRVMQPRRTAWLGDPEAEYTYSGLRNAPRPWIPALLELRARAEQGDPGPRTFNSVLANLYRDERDSMGLHADNERELGPDPVIASVSLGETRRFQLRHRKKGVPGVDLNLTHGSLLVMAGTTQRFWRHGVPRETSPRGPRINLTFRKIYPVTRG